MRRIAEIRSRSTAVSTSSSVISSAVVARRAAAVVDEDVDASERFDRLLDEALQVLRVRDVAANGERSEPLRLSLELVPAAREHGDVRALRAQRLGGRQAHPGGRAADDARCGR